jgi:hypothetical protein
VSHPSQGWVITLRGPERELAELPLASSTEWQVTKEGDEYVLRSPRLSAFGPDDDTEVLAVAKTIAEVISGVIVLEGWGVGAVEADAMAYVLPDGTRKLLRFTADSLTVRERATVSDTDPNSRFARLTELALRDESVQRVLLFLMQDTWSGYYNAVKEMEHEAGGRSNLSTIGEVSVNNIDLLMRTANSYGAIGPVARHPPGFQPPSKPMTIDEARATVIQLMYAWANNRL